MIKDPRSKALSDNFAGQWLRARDIESMEIEPIGALRAGRRIGAIAARIMEVAAGTAAAA